MIATLTITVAVAVLIAVILAREIQVRRALETLLGNLLHKKGAEHETEIHRADTDHPDDDHAADDDGRMR
ncbi:MAG: hypothetical protein ABGX22_24970 [Pirellulaceae bacterium]